MKRVSNRLHYTLITIIAVLFVAVAVYALTPGVAPNPGHVISNVAPPSACSSGQFLKWDGTAWVCGVASATTATGWEDITENINKFDLKCEYKWVGLLGDGGTYLMPTAAGTLNTTLYATKVKSDITSTLVHISQVQIDGSYVTISKEITVNYNNKGDFVYYVDGTKQAKIHTYKRC